MFYRPRRGKEFIMSGSGKKIAGVVVVLLVLAAAGAFVGVPMWEKEQARKVEAALAALPGGIKAESVEVSLWKQGATLRGVSGSLPYPGGLSTFSASEMTVNGLNPAAPKSSGVVKVLDSAAFRGVTIKSTLGKLETTERVESGSMGALSGDLSALAAGLKGGTAADLLPALDTFRLEGLRLEKISSGIAAAADRGPLEVRADLVESKVLAFKDGISYSVSGIGVTSGMPDGSDIATSISLLRVDGANPRAAYEDKDGLAVKGITLTGLVVKGRSRGIDQNITIPEVSLRDIYCNAGGMTRVLAEGGPQDAILPYIMQMRLGGLETKGWSIELRKGETPVVKTSLGSFTVRDLSSRQVGEWRLDSLNVEEMGKEKLHMGSLGSKLVRLPDFQALVGAALSGGNEDFREILDKSPLEISGYQVRDVRMAIDAANAFAVKSVDADLRLDGKKLAIQKKVEGLVIPPMLLAAAGMDTGAFAEMYGKPLELSGAMDFDGSLNQTGGSLFLRKLNVVEKNLGNASISGEMSFEGKDGDPLKGAEESLKLVKADVEVRDTGFMDLLFRGQYREMQALGAVPQGVSDAAALRRMTAEGVAAQAASATSAEYKAVMRSIAQFVQNSGSLSISLNPPKPISLDAFDHAESLPNGTLNMRAVYTAPAPAEAKPAAPAEAKPAAPAEAKPAAPAEAKPAAPAEAKPAAPAAK